MHTKKIYRQTLQHNNINPKPKETPLMNNPDINQIDGGLAVNILQQLPTPIMAVNRDMMVVF